MSILLLASPSPCAVLSGENCNKGALFDMGSRSIMQLKELSTLPKGGFVTNNVKKQPT